MPSDAVSPVAASAAAPALRLDPWRTFGIAVGGTFLVSLDGTIVIAAFPAMGESFDRVSPAILSWVLSAYAILFAALLILFGRVADVVGARRLFLVGLATFTLASALCALAPSAGALVAARAVQAIGGAMLLPASLTLILAAFPARQRAAVVGLWTAVGALAAALGPGLGGALIQAAGWPAAFLVNLPVGLGLFWFGSRLPETEGHAKGARLDVPGTAILVLALGALTFGVVSIDGSDRQADVVLGLASGALALVSYAAWARGRPQAIIDLNLFRDRAFAFATLAAFVFGIAFSLLFLGSFLFLTTVWRFSEAAAGLAVMPGPLLVIPVAILGGRLAGLIGHRPLLIAGALGLALSNAILAATVTEVPALWETWLPLQVLGGLSVGLLLPALSGAAVAHLPAARFGVGGAAHTCLRQFGGVIGTAVTVVLVADPATGLGSFQTLFLLLAGLCVATALLCLPIRTLPIHPA